MKDLLKKSRNYLKMNKEERKHLIKQIEYLKPLIRDMICLKEHYEERLKNDDTN